MRAAQASAALGPKAREPIEIAALRDGAAERVELGRAAREERDEALAVHGVEPVEIVERDERGELEHRVPLDARRRGVRLQLLPRRVPARGRDRRLPVEGRAHEPRRPRARAQRERERERRAPRAPHRGLRAANAVATTAPAASAPASSDRLHRPTGSRTSVGASAAAAAGASASGSHASPPAPPDEHEQDRPQTDRDGRARPQAREPRVGERAIVGDAPEQRGVDVQRARVPRGHRDPDDGPHALERRRPHLVGEHAVGRQVGAVEHLVEVDARRVAPAHGRHAPRDDARRVVEHALGEARAVDRGEDAADVGDGRVVGQRHELVDEARLLAAVQRHGVARHEVAQVVGELGPQPPRVGRGDRGGLTRDALDGARLGARERAPRARADADDARARVAREQPLGDAARDERQRGRAQIDGDQPRAQLRREVRLEPRREVEAIGRRLRLLVEAHDDERLVVIGGELERDGRIGPRLREQLTHVLGVGRDAARLLALEVDAREQIGHRPRARDARLRPQHLGEAPELVQDDRRIAVGAHVDEGERRRAPLVRADAQARRDAREHRDGREREQQHDGRRAREAVPRERRRPARLEEQPRLHGGRRRERRRRAREPHARDGHERERRRRPRGRRERHAERAPAREAAHERPRLEPREHDEEDGRRDEGGWPPGRAARARIRKEHARPHAVARGHGGEAQPRGRERLPELAARVRDIVDVDEEAHVAPVGRQEPSERVGAPHDALPRLLAVALARPAREDAARGHLPGRVERELEQPRWAVDAPHARHGGQSLLGGREGLAVGRREGVVHLDRQLDEAHEVEPDRRLASARHGGGAPGRPGERIGRPRGRGPAEQRAQRHGQDADF